VSKIPNVIGSTRISSNLDGGVCLDPVEMHRRRALRKDLRRKRRETLLQDNSGNRRLSSAEHDEDTGKQEDVEDSPLHSLMTTSNIQQEDSAYYSPSLKTNKSYNQSCQIDTNEKLSLEEQEARKSLLNIKSSQVCKCPNKGNVRSRYRFE
jgi:hypothetical protein